MAGNIVTLTNSDKVLILDPRNAFKRQTSVGSSWTQIKMGMYFNFVPVGSDEAASVAETIVPASYRDRICFGFSNAAATAVGVAGTQFLGMVQGYYGNVSITTNFGQNSTVSTGAIAYAGGLMALNGTTQLSQNGGNNFPAWNMPPWNYTTHGFLGMQLTVSNFGLSSQTITISTDNTVATITDASLTALRAKIFGSSFSGSSHVATWNEAGAALPLPDTFWVNSPFFNNRLRISAHAIYQIT